jgi:hypothetical protein
MVQTVSVKNVGGADTIWRILPRPDPEKDTVAPIKPSKPNKDGPQARAAAVTTQYTAYCDWIDIHPMTGVLGRDEVLRIDGIPISIVSEPYFFAGGRNQYPYSLR